MEKAPQWGLLFAESGDWTNVRRGSERLPMEPRLWNISLSTD